MGKVVLVACTSVGRHMIEAIRNLPELREVELGGVVNLKPEAGVGKANYDPYLDLLKTYGIACHFCDNINEPAAVDFIRAIGPDILLQSGWSQKFRKEVLGLARYACIGEHPAPLPRGRGAACVNWAILQGETLWGDSFFQMQEEYDTGCVFAQESFEIAPYDNVKTVYDKVAACSAEILRKHLKGWTEGKLEGKKQDDRMATYYRRRRPEDGLFAFTLTAAEVHNRVRAQTRPYPGAFYLTDEGRKVYVWSSALPGGEPEALAPGTVARRDKQNGSADIACGDGRPVTLFRVQTEGRPEAWACDFCAGLDRLQRADAAGQGPRSAS